MGELAEEFISKKRMLNRTTFRRIRLSDFQNHSIMNKRLTVEVLSFLLIATMISFSACIKDTCKQDFTYTYYEAVYKTKAEVRANIKTNSPRQAENTGKIYIRGNYIFLNEVDRGVHVINNANPSQPVNVAFIDIPGNMDMAVKENILYADLYTDLVAIDITDPLNVKVKKVIDGIFPYRFWGGGFVGPASNGDLIVTDWVKKDTTVTSSCNQPGMWWGRGGDVFLSASASSNGSSSGGSAGASSSPIGAGGSMARFTIMNERLYTVGLSELDVFNISNAADPQRTNTISVGGWNIETIYPFKDNLFIGSRSGMFIFNVVNADAPTPAGQFQHASSCDPVIADDNYAYVTLRSGTECEGFTNQLDIVKLNNNFGNPVLEKTYPMKNPHGLSKDGDLLFICDGAAGLKLYNAANVSNLQLINEISDIETFDVIAMNKIALVVAKDGLYQYSYADLSNIRLLSKFTIDK